MRVTSFYSSQSDLPNNTNRGFIERALEKAIDSIKAEAEMVIEPCLERDVQGETGSPDIAQTIFRKIEACRIFIGDVSIINPVTTIDRKTPNPNVLLELGYAAKTLTWEYVICVYNTAFGGVKDLPFDLQTRLMCTYSATENQANKSEERGKLTTKLRTAFLPMLERITHSTLAVSTDEQKAITHAAFIRLKQELDELLTGAKNSRPMCGTNATLPIMEKEHGQKVKNQLAGWVNRARSEAAKVGLAAYLPPDSEVEALDTVNYVPAEKRAQRQVEIVNAIRRKLE
jgi:hypothetical protein